MHKEMAHGSRDAGTHGPWRTAEDFGPAEAVASAERRNSTASGRYLAGSPHIDIPAPYGSNQRTPLAATLVSASHVSPPFFGEQQQHAGLRPDERQGGSSQLSAPLLTPSSDSRPTIDILDQLLDRVRITRNEAAEADRGERARRAHRSSRRE
jgi:hypothetical protein